MQQENGQEYINDYQDDYSDVHVLHKIDFNVPGVYVVTLEQGYMSCTFPIQVIDIEDYMIEE